MATIPKKTSSPSVESTTPKSTPKATRLSSKNIGRPRIQLDWDEIEKLCVIQCTHEEIAGWFNASVETLDRACRRDIGKPFAEYYQQKKGTGKISLRRRQWQAMQAGDKTMMIWLGKQYLGQGDMMGDTDDRYQESQAIAKEDPQTQLQIIQMILERRERNVNPETNRLPPREGQTKSIGPTTIDATQPDFAGRQSTNDGDGNG